MMKKKILFYLFCMLVAGVTACGQSTTETEATSDAAQTVSLQALKAIDLTIGGGKIASKGSTVAVHYSGWIYSDTAKYHKGKLFDTSSDSGEPLVFTLGKQRVIKGWEEGIVGMKVGGTRRLFIPSNMAYGEKQIGTARASIPAHSALVFDVKLLDIQ
ncbi:MAG TPA: FKBP-type peptidyl-prolyl cis-trans isomerase [Gammaproteobacteria bacterium]|nr:FKBP-type peptidyl-prolyl cis-trans isomerase [Gammaproteobacteria bacterium]